MTARPASFLCGIVLLVLAGRAFGERAPAPAEPAYRWQPKTVYRFNYEKKIEVQQVIAGREPVVKATEMQGVLVLRTENVDALGTAAASMSLESVRLAMPPYRRYDDDVDEFRNDERLAAALNREIEDTFIELVWQVKLDRHGRMEILSREPQDLVEAFQRVMRTLRMPKKLLRDMGASLESRFGLSPGRMDDQILAALQPAGDLAQAGGYEILRTDRKLRIGTPDAARRVKLDLSRQARVDPAAGESVRLENIFDRAGTVRLKPGAVESSGGQAVFDLELGMLDELSERYVVLSSCANRDRSLDQTATIVYRLKRLAPAPRGEDAETDAKP
ncbi:MAG: hypothetical protein M5U26_27030 [Planctomycetota bacterium]|nr:hypothetical protein [Planctomycetota bacterium]